MPLNRKRLFPPKISRVDLPLSCPAQLVVRVIPMLLRKQLKNFVHPMRMIVYVLNVFLCWVEETLGAILR